MKFDLNWNYANLIYNKKKSSDTHALQAKGRLSDDFERENSEREKTEVSQKMASAEEEKKNHMNFS